jgi:hypothetical protein
LKTHKRGCTLDASNYTELATDHNSFSVLAETSSPVPCKTAAQYRLYGGIPNCQTYPTVRCLSRVLDNETKGRREELDIITLGYTWQNATDTEIRATCRIIKL